MTTQERLLTKRVRKQLCAEIGLYILYGVLVMVGCVGAIDIVASVT